MGDPELTFSLCFFFCSSELQRLHSAVLWDLWKKLDGAEQFASICPVCRRQYSPVCSRTSQERKRILSQQFFWRCLPISGNSMHTELCSCFHFRMYLWVWLQIYGITPVGSVNYGSDRKRAKITNLQNPFSTRLLQASKKSAFLSISFASVSIPPLENGELNPESAGLEESLLEQDVQKWKLKIM